MRLPSLVSTLIASTFAAFVGVTACSSSEDANKGPWVLTWSDEFDGTTLDGSKWAHELGASFGTQQLDFDTDSTDNASLDGNGMLVITARKEQRGTNGYTSARLNSRGKFAQKYGRFEARMKLPTGQGMWPAFWLLGDDYDAAGWPGCGEIDIMENRGSEKTICHGSLHGPGFSGGDALTNRVTLPGNAVFADDFHLFAIEWEEGVVRFYVDTALYQTREVGKLARNDKWVFDHPFFIIVNLAVGGAFGGDPDASTVFPQSLLVDYVRVYSR